MGLLKFSFVVPTRDRPETLDRCIAALLTQDYPNYEIVVQDNASGPETAASVARFADPRISYRRSDDRVSMRVNFERAVRRATGDFVILFGDDDSVLPNACRRLSEIIARTGAEIVNWSVPGYLWPIPDQEAAGFLSFKRRKYYGGWRIVDCAQTLTRLRTATELNYLTGALCYHGCVSRPLIDRMAARQGGEYFAYHIPDIYAAVANLYGTKFYVELNHPLSISGWSPKSNGRSQLYDIAKTSHTSHTPYQQFTVEAKSDPSSIPFNQAVRSLYYHTLVSLDVAGRLLGDTSPLAIDKWIDASVRETLGAPAFHFAMSGAEELYSFDAAFIARTKPFPPEAPPPPARASLPINRPLRAISVHTPLDGADDIASATRIAADLLGDTHEMAPETPLTKVAQAAKWLAFYRRAQAYNSRRVAL